MNVNDGDRVILILFFAVLIGIGLRLAILVLRGEKPVKVRSVKTIKFSDQTPLMQDDPTNAVIAQLQRTAAQTRAQVQASDARQASRDASYTAADEIIVSFGCGVSDKMDE